MDWGRARNAALAFLMLAFLALPLAEAEPVPPSLMDTSGPEVTNVIVTPNPVIPSAVMINATAEDLESNITYAEFWIDVASLSGTSSFRMAATDGGFDSLREDASWLGLYGTFTQGIGPGLHRLLVQARDQAGNWGPYATAAFIVADPATTGPSVTALSASPEDLPTGAVLTIEAFLYDGFGRRLLAAEFFLDGEGAAGNGTAMRAVDGAFGGPTEFVNWSGLLDLPPGVHTAWVHGLNDRMVWGPVEKVEFTARAPTLTLRLLADRTEAHRGEVVTYSILFENRGNADATQAWIDVELPLALRYADDTASAAGGTPTGPTGWLFANVSPGGRVFTVRAQVPEDARDGQALTATARLDYTNERGWNFPELSAEALGSIMAPELRLATYAPDTVYAGETFDLVIELDHTGFRTIPSVDVTVEVGSWASPIRDNAADLGGEPLGMGSWRLYDLVPGLHRLVVTSRVGAASVELPLAPIGIAVEYLSREGSLAALQETPSMSVARPLIAVTADVDRATAIAGEALTFIFDYENRGSATSRNVALEVKLPDDVELVGGDAPAYSSGTRHTWLFSDVGPGESGRVTILAAGRREMAAEVFFELTYSSPNGVFLERLTSSAALTVHPVPPPLTPMMSAIAFAGTTIALAGLVATERGKTALLFLLFLPLYTRLRHDKILDHETRGMIRGYVVANPGDHYNSIKEALELPNGTLAYHIQVLQKEMIVRSVKDGKFRRFYPAEMRIPEGGEPTKIQRVILDLIRTNPGITPRDAAGLLGLTSSTVFYHLEKLEEHKRIEYRREGITKRLYVRGDLEAP